MIDKITPFEEFVFCFACSAPAVVLLLGMFAKHRAERREISQAKERQRRADRQRYNAEVERQAALEAAARKR